MQETAEGNDSCGPVALRAGQGLIAVAGEEIALDVDLHNPLSIQLQLTQLHVHSDDSCSTNIRVSPVADCPTALLCCAVCSRSSSLLQVIAEELVLRGGERTRARLRFRGLSAGSLSITGVSWLVEGVIKGYRPLKIGIGQQTR